MFPFSKGMPASGRRFRNTLIVSHFHSYFYPASPQSHLEPDSTLPLEPKVPPTCAPVRVPSLAAVWVGKSTEVTLVLSQSSSDQGLHLNGGPGPWHSRNVTHRHLESLSAASLQPTGLGHSSSLSFLILRPPVKKSKGLTQGSTLQR